MLDIRRHGVTESEYHSRASTFEKIVFYEKFGEALDGYIESFMGPKEVTVKGESFALLEKALLEWKKINREERARFLTEVENASEGSPSLRALRDQLAKPFLTHRNGPVSTREFLEYFETSRIPAEEKSMADFRTRLHAAVKQSIRDYFLIKEASVRDLQKHPLVQKELALWRSNWVYQETRRRFLESEERVVQNASVLIQKKAEKLRSRYTVEVNDAVLDTINVVDFKKSRWATLQIFRTGSNRMAYPVVDPRWSAGEQ
jgi:hypothetical protein